MTILFYIILAILIIATLIIINVYAIEFEDYLIGFVIGAFIDGVIILLLFCMSSSEQLYKTHQIYSNNSNTSVKIVTTKTKTTFESGKQLKLSKTQVLRKLEDDELPLGDSFWQLPTGTLTMSKDKDTLSRDVDIIVTGKRDANIVTKIDYGTVTRRKKLFENLFILPLKRNPYLDECLKKGERLPFVQVRITDKTCTISAIVGYDKAPLRPSTESIGLDFGMVSMFTTSDGERHGLSSFTKLKIWDKELLDLSQNLQKQSIKFSTNERYIQLQQRIKSYFKNEICRILNKLANKNVGVFAVEHLDFRAAGMSKQMNRLIGRTYRSVVKAKLTRLEEQYGIQIIAVNPAYTSQECSRCHYVSKENRKTQKDFVCQHCHFSCNADVNAGRIINQRRSLMLEFPVYAKRSASRTVRCQVQEASKECHKRYCHDNGLMTYEESLAKGSL